MKETSNQGRKKNEGRRMNEGRKMKEDRDSVSKMYSKPTPIKSNTDGMTEFSLL